MFVQAQLSSTYAVSVFFLTPNAKGPCPDFHRSVLLCHLSYRQQKFNLFREESEGYSKLIAELLRLAVDPDPPTPSTVLENVKALIGEFRPLLPVGKSSLSLLFMCDSLNNALSRAGFFDLDPNRVADVALDALEVSYQRDQRVHPLGKDRILSFLVDYRPDPDKLTDTLAFKFSACSKVQRGLALLWYMLCESC
jgi:THO complex subunit 2